MKRASLSFLLILSTTNSWAQATALDSLATATLSGISFSASVWGDIDNDGDLDLIAAGEDTSGVPLTQIFTNDGSGTFTTATGALPHVRSGALSLGDLDNDGDVDLILTGIDSSGQTVGQALLNDGQGNFSSYASLPGASRAASATADLTGDGRVDVIATGLGADGLPFTKMLVNTGFGFSEKSSGLPDIFAGMITPGDLNNDGSVDILLSGLVNDNLAISKIYHNNGTGTFVEAAGANLIGLFDGGSALGDSDQDGDLDILLAGQSALGTAVTKIYRNEGNGIYTDILAPLAGVTDASVAWGDFNNDGNLDAFVSGAATSGMHTSVIYDNAGSNSFASSVDRVTGVSSGRSSFADIDGDGDIDFLLTGSDTTGLPTANLFANVATTANSRPSPPAELTFALTETELQFAWQPASDQETSAASLTYNIRIGTAPGGSDLLAPHALSSGRRTVVSHGNAYHKTTWALPVEAIKSHSNIYWSVQAVDPNFAGSAFSVEQTFASPFTQDQAGSASLPGVNASSVDWGDFDNDGDLDILITGQDASNLRIATIYRNDGASVMTPVNAGLDGVAASAAAWGDYDGDGLIDILLTGFSASNQGIAKIYRNNGDQSFSDIGAGLEGIFQGSVDWGDVDNDGDLDILLSGLTQSNQSVSRVFRNSAGQFSDIGAALIGVSGGKSAWGDADNDGDLDILITGTSLIQGNVAKLYRNDGDGTFVDMNAGLTGVTSSSAAWGDYDADGDLDILLSGSSASGRITKLYRNNGSGTFAEVPAGLDGVSNGTVAWGDYDNDGDLDILLNGFDNQFTRTARVYRNDAGVFSNVNAFLDGVIFGTGNWADFDNDGDLDILLTGSSAQNRVANIYKNNSTTQNDLPGTPAGLASTFTPSSLAFTWDATTDAQTPTAALTYNIRVGTSPGGNDIVAAMSLASGSRQVVKQGNTGPSTNRTVQIPDILSYPAIFWSVQTVDQVTGSSAFAVEESFGPQILSVKDVPNDQGQRVTLKWKASSLDHDLNRLTSYSVWRSIPEMAGSAQARKSDSKHFRAAAVNGEMYSWEWLATVPAHRRETYSFTATTLYDSMATIDGKHFFLLSAHTDDANIFFDSQPDSGFSIDNLAPNSPVNLAGQLNAEGVAIRWARNTETDLQGYLVYSSDQPGINTSMLQPVASTRDTFFVDLLSDSQSSVYLVIVAADSNGNHSSASDELAFTVTSVQAGGSLIPSEFSLSQNYPNPFNPTTRIEFALPELSHVLLEVYNLVGGRVATVVDRQLDAGSHAIEFNAGELPSGAYFYRVQAKHFTQVRKMILLQ